MLGRRSPVLRGCFGESYVDTSPCPTGIVRFGFVVWSFLAVFALLGYGFWISPLARDSFAFQRAFFGCVYAR